MEISVSSHGSVNGTGRESSAMALAKYRQLQIFDAKRFNRDNAKSRSKVGSLNDRQLGSSNPGEGM